MANQENNPKKYTDLTYLRESSGDNEVFIKEMISIFLKQTPDFLNLLDVHVKDKNLLEFRQVLHKLKPTISFMGIHSLEGTVRRLEKAAKETFDFNELGEGVEELRTVCELAYKELGD